MILEAREVVAGYGRIPVLHGVSLELDRSEAVAVIGPNGAGKSTLMKTLARQLPLMGGELRYADQPYGDRDSAWAARNGIGLVPQTNGVFPGLSVAENLRVGAWLHPEPDRAVQDAMVRFPMLAERAAQPAEAMSGGERQILAISSALLMRPQVLLLDEPTGGLAPRASRLVIDWVSEIIAEGTAVVWVVEQTPELVLERVHRAYMLEAGQVRYAGSPAQLLEDGRLEEVMLRKA